MKKLFALTLIILMLSGVAFAAPPVPIQPAGSGSVATDAIFTAKGDLALGTGNGTAAKLTVGANYSIPYALSTEATGWKWLAPVASGIVGYNAAGVLGVYTSILIDNSAAQFKDATDATKLWTISPVNFGTGVDFTFSPTVAADTTFSPTISATAFDIGSLKFATTGTITGAVNTNADADGMTQAQMTTAGMYGTMFWATGAGTWNLPGAATGMSICVYSTTAAAIVINPDDGDTIVLNGTALSAGDSITSASGAGDFICLIAKDANTWYTLGRSGTWTDTN